MRRIDIVCTHCRQVNVRYDGWGRFLLNPRWAETCTLCAKPLDGSPPDLGDVVRGRLMWSIVYFLHAFAGLGVFMLGASILWPGIINEPPAMRVAPMVVGAIAGLALAEWSRRRGTLLGNRRR